MTAKTKSSLKNKRQRILIAIVSTAVAAILIFGASVGIITAINAANSVVHYDGIQIGKGETYYLASRYKSLYIQSLTASGVKASDTPTFWASTDEESGSTYGQLLADGTREYIADIVAANRIFYDYASYTSDHAKKVEDACYEVVRYQGGGSVDSFNAATAVYGFNYEDFKSASAMIYRASLAKSMIYGTDGSGLASFTEECDKYFEQYTHVMLLFFRRTTKIADDGSIANLTEEEIAERTASIEAIRTYIANRDAGAEDAISPETFEVYYERSDGDPNYYDTGYYLHPNAEQTGYFMEAFPEIYETVLEMELGDYAEASWDVDLDPDTEETGVCFIYKCENVSGAYADEENLMFSDFYSDAATYHYTETVSEISPYVEFKEKYSELDPVAIPSNSRFYVRSFN